MNPFFRLAFLLIFLFAGSNLKAQYQLIEAFPNLQFTQPVEFISANDESNRIFIVSQQGQIFVFPNDSAVTAAKLFLDISSKVIAGGERGLLGLAFHPEYISNGYFYVNYTRADDGATVISRYQLSANDSDAAEPATELVLLIIPQPFENHNGGKIAFGRDGYLYIASGDGGGGGDPQNNAQNRGNLLGKILRIDVNNLAQGMNYGIPADNPFVGNTAGYREEIYAYGLRNPWKFSIDSTSGAIWLADVGQNAVEEIDTISKGGNYGWAVMEGVRCYNPATNCDTSGLILPVWEYTHASEAGRSITGGYVYRGEQLSELIGKYIYGDFVSGLIWALTVDENGNTRDSLLASSAKQISSFGVDNQQELYVCSYSEGKIYRLVNTAVASVPAGSYSSAAALYPNPSTGEITIELEQKVSALAHLKIYNSLGREVATPVNNLRIEAGTVKLPLKLNALPDGLYFYLLHIERDVYTGKFLIEKQILL
jgi:glucose/arabinose dehydrogenase